MRPRPQPQAARGSHCRPPQDRDLRSLRPRTEVQGFRLAGGGRARSLRPGALLPRVLVCGRQGVRAGETGLAARLLAGRPGQEGRGSVGGSWARLDHERPHSHHMAPEPDLGGHWSPAVLLVRVPMAAAPSPWRGTLGASGHPQSLLSPVRRASSVRPALRALSGQRSSVAPRPGGTLPPGVPRQWVFIPQTLDAEAT